MPGFSDLMKAIAQKRNDIAQALIGNCPNKNLLNLRDMRGQVGSSLFCDFVF